MVVTDKTVKGKDLVETADEASHASPGTEQGTPEPQYVTMAQLETAVKEAAKRAVNLDRMQHGRDEKVMKERESEIARREREADEKIRESLRDDPDRLSAYDLKKRADEDRRRADAKEARANERLIKASAKEAGLEYDELFDLSGGDPDIAEKLALRLASKKEKQTETVDSSQDTKTVETPVPPKRMVSVSGKTAGSTKGLTVETVKGMSPEEQNRHIDEIAKLPLGGFKKPTDKDYR